MSYKIDSRILTWSNIFHYCRDVTFFPPSPRLRRRVLRGGLAAAVVGAAAVAAVAMPRGEPLPVRATPGPAPVPLPATADPEPATRLTPAIRREIDAVLARFIPAAVRRDDPAVAWTLSGPRLRTGWTRDDWLNDRIPVFPYPASPTGFQGWRKIYAFERRVGLDLVIQPSRPGIGALAVGVEMVRRGDRWLVNEWTPVANFTPPDSGRQWVTGVADFNAGGWTDKGLEQKPARARLGSEWLVLPLALIALALVVPAGLGIAAARRNRRARAQYTSAPDARVTWRTG
jgi:hypothetical protein